MKIIVRNLEHQDFDEWLTLWNGYNEFYGRVGATALSDEMNLLTWNRFFDPLEPIHALVATLDGTVVGLAHLVMHRATSRPVDICYLSDLFTSVSARGNGVGAALIKATYDYAKQLGSTRVYWHTYSTNTTARSVYDKVAEHLGALVYVKEL